MSQLRTNSIVPVGGIPAGADGGGIIQVVQYTTTATFATTSTTYVDTGLTASITPRSTSNKILILVSAEINFYRSGSGGVGSGLKIERSGTAIVTTPNDYGLFIEAAASGASNVASAQRISLNYLASPSSTSSLTYTLYGKNYSGGTSTFQSGANPSYMILMEVAA